MTVYRVKSLGKREELKFDTYHMQKVKEPVMLECVIQELWQLQKIGH